MKRFNPSWPSIAGVQTRVSCIAGLAAAGFATVAFVQSPTQAASGDTPVVMYSWDMSVDPGWEMEGEWEYGIPTGQGGDSFGLPDPTSGATGDQVLGINNYGDFSIEPGGPYRLTSPVIDCSELQQTTLRFMRWLNMDWQPYVHSSIEVTNDGENWTILWENDLWEEVAEYAWSQHEFDISAVADGYDAVQVRWTYTINQDAWAYSGWNLDDIEIVGVDGSAEDCVGDLNGDLAVQGDDLTILLGEWGTCSNCLADLDGDGTVDGTDLTLMLGNWGFCF